MNSVLKSKKLRDSARNQDCTLCIAGVCNYNPETTVLCHFPSDVAGSKPTDFSAGYGCSDCHDVIDRRVNSDLSEADREYYMRRSMTRTLNSMWLKDLIKVHT